MQTPPRDGLRPGTKARNSSKQRMDYETQIWIRKGSA